MDERTNNSPDNCESSAAELQLKTVNEQLKATNQQLRASQQQFRAANQQLEANNRQFMAGENDLRFPKTLPTSWPRSAIRSTRPLKIQGC